MFLTSRVRLQEERLYTQYGMFTCIGVCVRYSNINLENLEKCAFRWFMFYNYITIHCAKNINILTHFLNILTPIIYILLRPTNMFHTLQLLNDQPVGFHTIKTIPI